MRSLISEALKTGIALLLYYSGACWLYARWRLRNRAIVLMYHRVLTGEQIARSYSASSIVVTPGTFERQMRLLHRWLSPIEPGRLASMLSGKSEWIPRACAVTFDDGWFDNAENALPILSRTRTPATVFLATGFVGTQDCFWQERLATLLNREWREHGPASEIFRDLGANQILANGTADVRTQIRIFVTSIKGWPRADLYALIERIERATIDAESHSSVDRFMSWDDARRLRESEWVTLGSHGHSHTPLTMLAGNELKNELAHANAVLTAEIGKPSLLFAYPNGDHDDPSVSAVRHAGYELAFTTRPGSVAPGDDCLRLKRINISEGGTDTDARFLCRLFGWF